MFKCILYIFKLNKKIEFFCAQEYDEIFDINQYLIAFVLMLHLLMPASIPQ